MTTDKFVQNGTTKYVFDLDLDDLKLDASGTGNVIDLITLPQGVVPQWATIKTTDPAVGASVSAATVQLKADTVALHTAQSIFSAITGSVPLTSAALATLDDTAGTDITLTLTTTGANVSVLSAGACKVTIWCQH